MFMTELTHKSEISICFVI